MPLLDVKQHHLVVGAAKKASGSGVEDGIRGCARRSALLGHLVAQVFYHKLVGGLVQHSETVARHEDGAGPCASLGISVDRDLRLSTIVASILGDHEQLVRAALGVGIDQNSILGGVVGHGAGTLVSSSCAGTTDGDKRIIPLLSVVVCAEVAVLHVVQHAGVRAIRGALTLQFEHDHATVVTRGQQIHLRVGGKDPKPVVLATEGLHAGTLGHIPHADAFVLGVRDDDVLTSVKHDAGHIVDVPAKGVDLPCLGVVHAPQLHLAIVRPGNN